MNTNNGWKMVPVEPTSAMWAAVNKLDDQMAAGGYDGKGASIEQVWNCLVDAAPTLAAQHYQWLITVAQMKVLAAELIRAAESMGGDDEESYGIELVLAVAPAATVQDDDGVWNEQPILTVRLEEYPEEGVYPIDPQDPTGGRVDTHPAAPTAPAANGWLDIASAPKDGTPVLLFARHIDAEASTRVVGWFNAEYGWIAQSYVGQPFARLIPSLWAELMPFPGYPAEAPAYTVTVDPDPRGVSVGVYQGSSCVYHGAHPILASTVADERAVKRLRDAIEGECGGNWISEKQAAAVLAHLGHAAPAAGDARDAARYRWLRDPKSDPALVLDKRTGYVPVDETIPGVGGYHTYEYRAGEELDAAIDAAISASQQGGE